MENNYVAYMKISDGQEHEGLTAETLSKVYDEASRFAKEYNPVEAGVRVYTPGCLKIISWKDGKYWRGKGKLLYTIRIK